MAAHIETQECYPRPIVFDDLIFPAPEPAHERCSGGHTTPGLLGGWVCPCPCHHEKHETPRGFATPTPGVYIAEPGSN